MPGFVSLRREIVAERSTAYKTVGLVVAILLPALLRWVVDRGTGGAPFVTFWPAVLLATAFLGWRYGLATAIASTLIAVFVFIPSQRGGGAAAELLVILPFFALGIAIMILFGHLLRNVIIALDARVRQSDAFNRELQHRAKNSLQMIRALASRASRATDPVEFYQTLSNRLEALGKANELLRFGVRESCPLDELVAVALRPFPSAQIACSGPPCLVGKDTATPLTMAIHELGTNASKYGALSTPDGKVSLTWDHCGDGQIRIEWIERGGPEVVKPTRFGVGRRLLQAYGPLRAVEVEYPSDGVRCQIRIDAAKD
jgi:two-component sensor histidine kinase